MVAGSQCSIYLCCFFEPKLILTFLREALAAAQLWVPQKLCVLCSSKSLLFLKARLICAQINNGCAAAQAAQQPLIYARGRESSPATISGPNPV